MAKIQDEQILVLPSNVSNSNQLHDNTHSDFTTILKVPLQFPNKENYEVALLDFFGTFKLADEEISGEDAQFSIGQQIYNIRSKIYKKQNDILSAMNRSLKRDLLKLPLSCWKEGERIVVGLKLDENFLNLSGYLQLRLGVSNANKTYYHDRNMRNIPIFFIIEREYPADSDERQFLSKERFYINDRMFLHLFPSAENPKTQYEYITNQIKYKWPHFFIEAHYLIINYAVKQKEFRLFLSLKEELYTRQTELLQKYIIKNSSDFAFPHLKEDYPVYETPIVQKKVDMKGLNSALKDKTIYIYTDILRYSIVGDSLSPLLRAFPINTSQNQLIHFTPSNAIYLPLEKSFLDTVRISIRDQRGKHINFSKGPHSSVTVVISIRKKNKA